MLDENLDDYKAVIINGPNDKGDDMDFDDGFVESKELNYKVSQSFEKQLDSFFKKNNKQKNKE